MAIAAVAVLALAGGAAWSYSRPVPPTEVVNFDIPEDLDGVGPFVQGAAAATISPDGRHVVIAIGTGATGTRLALRSLDSTEFVILPGTEGATQPFWSPDSRSVAFIARSGEKSRLLRIDRDGRGLTTICEEARNRGAWGKAGLILIPSDKGLVSVP